MKLTTMRKERGVMTHVKENMTITKPQERRKKRRQIAMKYKMLTVKIPRRKTKRPVQRFTRKQTTKMPSMEIISKITMIIYCI